MPMNAFLSEKKAFIADLYTRKLSSCWSLVCMGALGSEG